MKTKLLTLIFALLLGLGAWGQGAASIEDAWNEGSPTSSTPDEGKYWFALPIDGDGFSFPPVKKIGKNSVIDYNEFAGSDARHSWDLIADVNDPTCSRDYEEWYIIKMPSIGDITIQVDFIVPGDNFFITLQWYAFDGAPFDIGNCGGSNGGLYEATKVSTGTLTLIFNDLLPSTSYIAIRLGNNSYPDPFFPNYTSYTISVSTKNNGTLPVEWLGFTGQPLGNSNRLNWSTATETQNDYFVLEKSADGVNYETLAQIPGQGDAIFQNDYSTLDESPYYQTYYRISQVDYDGTVNNGPQTVVINDSKKVYINLLANPVTNNEIKLRYRSDREQEVVFFLTSLDGKRVKSQTAHFIEGSSELNLAIPSVAPGLYLLSASVNGEQWTEKVVVR